MNQIFEQQLEHLKRNFEEMAQDQTDKLQGSNQTDEEQRQEITKVSRMYEQQVQTLTLKN